MPRKRSTKRVQLYIRKRPLFEHEVAKGAYDTVTVYDGVCRTLVHNCQMAADMVHMFVKHESFPSDAAFTEAASNTDVYYGSVQPLVQHATRGGVATVFMYGQTGSGKTYTMTGFEELAAQDIFAATSCMERGGRVSLAYFEIAGKTLNDLLGEA